MTRQVLRSGSNCIVYDDRCISHITPDYFTAAFWPHSSVVPGYAGGRGATLLISHNNDDWVLKHYHRGGLAGRWLNDGFLWRGLEHSRSVREWNLLTAMQTEGLPAPVPVAAHCRRSGLVYTADLITRRIADVQPFSTRLQAGEATTEVWHRVGSCIGRFHAAGYFHADLSTHNLQIDAADSIYLLDWDRGARRGTGTWRQQNLARLQRSCLKISRDGQAHFTPADWEALLDGYRERCQL